MKNDKAVNPAVVLDPEIGPITLPPPFKPIDNVALYDGSHLATQAKISDLRSWLTNSTKTPLGSAVPIETGTKTPKHAWLDIPSILKTDNRAFILGRRQYGAPQFPAGAMSRAVKPAEEVLPVGTAIVVAKIIDLTRVFPCFFHMDFNLVLKILTSKDITQNTEIMTEALRGMAEFLLTTDSQITPEETLHLILDDIKSIQNEILNLIKMGYFKSAILYPSPKKSKLHQGHPPLRLAIFMPLFNSPSLGRNLNLKTLKITIPHTTSTPRGPYIKQSRFKALFSETSHLEKWEDTKHTYTPILKAYREFMRHFIVHGDIKPDNIIQTETGFHFIDFAKSIPRENPFYTPNQCGSPEYLPPEFEGKLQPKPPVDIYALALILCELIYPLLAFYRCILEKNANAIIETRDYALRILRNSDMPDDTKKFITRMLSIVPADRPTPDEVFAHFGLSEALQESAEAAITIPQKYPQPVQFSSPDTGSPASSLGSSPSDIPENQKSGLESGDSSLGSSPPGELARKVSQIELTAL